MTTEAPFRTLIAGGGPAALEAALTLRDVAPDIDVTLVAPTDELRYRPLSTVAPFAHGEPRTYALDRLADRGVTVLHDGVEGVDAAGRSVQTTTGHRLGYDALLVATGAAGRAPYPKVTTFGGPDDIEAVHGLVQDVEEGYTRTVAFVAPPGAGWTLPIYELALQTAQWAGATAPGRVLVQVVSHEPRPLDALGAAASELVAGLLDEAGIAFVPGTERPAADRTVALPVPVGRALAGLPADAEGFLPVDAHGRVRGTSWVWGAGDGTDQPLKQGGLATQQAEAAARSIAAAAGFPVDTPPFVPELRAMLVTGRGVVFLHRPADPAAPTEVSDQPLWDPPTKIAGRRLGPFLDALDVLTPRANRFERRMVQEAGR
jgi:sulfide:quinone oxidoreductase